MHELRHPTTHEIHWPVKVPVQPLSRTRLLSAGSYARRQRTAAR
jgi:hypothetical protein